MAYPFAAFTSGLGAAGMASDSVNRAAAMAERMRGTRGLAKLRLVVVGCASFHRSVNDSQLKCGNGSGRCQGTSDGGRGARAGCERGRVNMGQRPFVRTLRQLCRLATSGYSTVMVVRKYSVMWSWRHCAVIRHWVLEMAVPVA